MTIRRRQVLNDSGKQEDKSWYKPSVYHAAIVIFFEFFAFGLLTTPMISVLNETFPKHTFLMNGIIHGLKGFLSFLSAPLIGALSDVYGRKKFLCLTVTFTCLPIPLMKISHLWYFTMVSLSGMFAVTFSVALAYVADITNEEERSWGYGLVSATFSASLVTSPAIGAYLGRIYSEELVVALATAIAFLDICFILACVPESLPEKVRSSHPCSISALSGPSGKFSWGKVDLFSALRQMTNDYLVLIICITTFLSYLPEAGQYSCFFVYLRLVMGFSEENVALFIAVVGIMSCISQTIILPILNKALGPKRAIVVGLIFEAIQLALYGFVSQPFLLWVAGLVAAMGAVTYPALSAFISKHAPSDQQGVAQGLVTGIRGLCGGLGPALFGLFFYIFQVDLNDQTPQSNENAQKLSPDSSISIVVRHLQEQFMPGPPFAFGSLMVLLAILVAMFIPENPKLPFILPTTDRRRQDSPVSGSFGETRYRRTSPTSHSTLSDPDTMSPTMDSWRSLPSNEYHRNPAQTEVIHDHEVNGIWNRILNSFGGLRRPPGSRRPTRTFRQTTARFTHSTFVGPLRRLLTGLSQTNTEQEFRFLNSAPQLPLSSKKFRSTSVSENHLLMRDYMLMSQMEAEAADLSNYRSHHFKRLLSSASKAEIKAIQSDKSKSESDDDRQRLLESDTMYVSDAEQSAPFVGYSSIVEPNRIGLPVT